MQTKNLNMVRLVSLIPIFLIIIIKSLVKVSYNICRSGGGVSPPVIRVSSVTGQGVGPWWGHCALRTCSFTLYGERKEGVGGKLNRTGRAPHLTGISGGPRCPTTGYGSHLFGTPEPWPPRCSGGWTRLEWSSLYSSRTCRYVNTDPFNFVVRRMAMCLSVTSASTPRRPSTEARKGVKWRRSLRQACGFFFLLSCSAVFRHFSEVFYW